jgi:hypothetical protein
MIARHVQMGRENLNFSAWQSLSEEDHEGRRQDVWEEVERGTMPLPAYLRMHPEAVLTSVQLEAIQRWSTGEESLFPDWDW